MMAMERMPYVRYEASEAQQSLSASTLSNQPDMPQSAIDAGCIDVVLASEQIAQQKAFSGIAIRR